MALDSMYPIRVTIPLQLKNVQVAFRVTTIEIGKPTNLALDFGDRRITPRECRELGVTYSAQAHVAFEIETGDEKASVVRSIGGVPIMVGSSRCAVLDMV